jgi:diguanylate cyclase (GGDEF)-like protein/hemerythrin-like metal-binding protein/PAS domain S-box-containing protein
MIDNEIEIFEVFPWNKNFEVGIELIDLQHKELVKILNKLASHLANLSTPLILNEVFDELANYADYHFHSEEEIWKANFKNDIWLLTHQKTHSSFIAEVIRIKDNKDNKSLDDVIHDIVSFLSQWLAYHILDNDKRMAKAVLSLQSGYTLEESKLIVEDLMSDSMELLINTVLTMYDSLSNRTLALMREKALRKKAEESLLQNEERWKVVLEGGLENVWDFEIKYDRNNPDKNHSLIDDFGKNVLKINDDFIIHPSDLGFIENDFKAHLNGETKNYSNKYRILYKDNSWSWILSRGKVVNSETNEKIRVVGTNTDITQKELGSIIYKNSSQGMFISDSNNNIISVNPSFTKITGYELKDVIGLNPKILSSKMHDYIFYKKMWNSITTNNCWSGEIKNKRKNNEIYDISLNINTVFDEKGNIDHYVALFMDITEKKKSEKLIFEHTTFDSLTHLYNRDMIKVSLEEEIKKTGRSKSIFALLFIDLDHFKDVNDTLGHEIGDLLLIEASKRISSVIRGTDIIGRFGGDEFVVILSDLKDITIIEIISNKIIEKLSEVYILGKEKIHISSSIGIGIYPSDGANSLELLSNAEQAMYKAKKNGRKQYHYYRKSLQIEAKKRQSLVSDLYSAIELNQFEVFYQPIINFETNKIEKAEALIRWNHPTKGLIPPNDFIPLSEQFGLIVPIGDWVYSQVVRQIRKWKDENNINIQVSINKSPIQFRFNKSVGDWFSLLKENNLTGKDICIEITENMVMEKEDIVTNKLLEFRNNEVDISLDDFGTGYSSLSYLKKFHIDYIKIDQSFVRNLSANSQDMVLCEAMIVMAHKLNIKVIAEGIETQAQMELLRQMDCDYGQGYLFSKPVAVKDFEKLF